MPAIGIAKRNRRGRERSRGAEGVAIADTNAGLQHACLHYFGLQPHHWQHRVWSGRCRIDAVERGTRPGEIIVKALPKKDAG